LTRARRWPSRSSSVRPLPQVSALAGADPTQ
jgi:hypothetical protein